MPERTIEISVKQIVAVAALVVVGGAAVLALAIGGRLLGAASDPTPEPITPTPGPAGTLMEVARLAAVELLTRPEQMSEDIFTQEFLEWYGGDGRRIMRMNAGADAPTFIGEPIVLWDGSGFVDVAYRYHDRRGYGILEFRMKDVDGEWLAARYWIAQPRRGPTWAELITAPPPEDALVVARKAALELMAGVPVKERSADLYEPELLAGMARAEERYGGEIWAVHSIPDPELSGDPIVLWAADGIYDLALCAAYPGGYNIQELRLALQDDGFWRVRNTFIGGNRGDDEGVWR